MQQVGNGEVGELQTQFTDNTCLSPTGRELYLVVGFGDEVITYIHRTVFRFGLDIRLDLFGVKVSHLLDFTHGTHQVFTAEKLSRTGTELTADYVFIQTVVTVDADFIDSSLTAFEDTHFQVDGVTYDIYFHGVERVEEVTVVVVEVADSVFICTGTLFQQLLIVDVALLHTEQEIQLLGRIEGVTYPRYIAQVVFLSFFDFHEDIHRTVVIRLDAVFYNHGITITQFVVFVYNQLLVGFKIFFDELFGTEKVEQFAFFIRFLHHTFQLLGCDGLITGDCNLMYLYLLLFVDIDIYQDLVLVVGIILLRDDDVGILETLIVKVALNQRLGAVYQVGGNLVSFNQTYPGFQIFTFRLLYTVIANIGNAGAHCQVDCKPNPVALDFIRSNLHVGEQSVTPVAFAGLRYFIAGHGNCLAF